MHVYLDESGHLNKGNGDYFVVGSYTVGDHKRIGKAFRKWQKRKFPKKIRGQSEVKFNNTSVDDNLRLKTIAYLAKQDIRIFYIHLKSANIPEEYRQKGKIHKTGLLYTEIIASTLELYLPIVEREFRVFRDKLTLKGVTTSQFNQALERHLLPKLPAKSILQIEAVDSASSPQVQIADWVSGALARYHEGKSLGEDLYNTIKNNIVKSKELFENYWEERWK